MDINNMNGDIVATVVLSLDKAILNNHKSCEILDFNSDGNLMFCCKPQFPQPLGPFD